MTEERIPPFVDIGQSHLTVMLDVAVQFCEGSTSPHPDGAQHDTTFIEGTFALTPPPDSGMADKGLWPPRDERTAQLLRAFIVASVVPQLERAMNGFPGASLVGWGLPDEVEADT